MEPEEIDVRENNSNDQCKNIVNAMELESKLKENKKATNMSNNKSNVVLHEKTNFQRKTYGKIHKLYCNRCSQEIYSYQEKISCRTSYRINPDGRVVWRKKKKKEKKTTYKWIPKIKSKESNQIRILQSEKTSKALERTQKNHKINNLKGWKRKKKKSFNQKKYHWRKKKNNRNYETNR